MKGQNTAQTQNAPPWGPASRPQEPKTQDAPSPPTDKHAATGLLSKQIHLVYKTPSPEKFQPFSIRILNISFNSNQCLEGHLFLRSNKKLEPPPLKTSVIAKFE